VAGNEGAQPNVPLDPSDQAAYNATWQEPTAPGLFNAVGDVANKMVQTANIQNAANLKAQLAQDLSSHSMMRVDPSQVESLAKFFEDEANKLDDHLQDSQELASVTPPGQDPVSTQAATAYGTVASGSPQAYLDNVAKLQKVFEETAQNLRASAQQTRTDDENAASGLRGGNLA
jgi:uncharacterized protein YukE